MSTNKMEKTEMLFKKVNFNEEENKELFFRKLQNEYLSYKQAKKSTFGERVTLKEVSLVEGIDELNGLSISAVWDVVEEKEEKVGEIHFNGTNIDTKETNNLIENQLPISNYIQSLYQMVLSGVYATKEDLHRYFQAANIKR